MNARGWGGDTIQPITLPKFEIIIMMIINFYCQGLFKFIHVYHFIFSKMKC